ncbi:helix-turn-helix transcriptional regulator [Desulfocastanea catecholica]
MRTKKNIKINIEMAKANMTQGRLASLAGIPRPTLNQIISGRINPTEEEKRMIAEALNNSVEEIFHE